MKEVFNIREATQFKDKELAEAFRKKYSGFEVFELGYTGKFIVKLSEKSYLKL